MDNKELYKKFIEECTPNAKSYKNYSDFNRINATIARMKGVSNFDIYDCYSLIEFDNLYFSR